MIDLPTPVDSLRMVVVVAHPLFLVKSIKLLQMILKTHKQRYGTADNSEFLKTYIRLKFVTQ